MCYSVCKTCGGEYSLVQCWFSAPSYCLKINPNPLSRNGNCLECADLELSAWLPQVIPLKYITFKLKLV